MNLEDQLVEALRRTQPPPGMVERVMAGITAREQAGDPLPFWRAHAAGLRVAAGVVLAVSVGVGILQQRQAQREREQAEFATQQLMTALQIASETLNDALRVVQQNQ